MTVRAAAFCRRPMPKWFNKIVEMGNCSLDLARQREKWVQVARTSRANLHYQRAQVVNLRYRQSIGQCRRVEPRGLRDCGAYRPLDFWHHLRNRSIAGNCLAQRQCQIAAQGLAAQHRRRAFLIEQV